MLSKYKNEFIEKGEVYMRIKVHPGAPKSMTREVMADETIKIDIAAAPERGRANEELQKYLAREFLTNVANVRIISGAGDRLKLVKIKSN